MMSNYKIGQEVVLTAEYRGYPKGTKGLFLSLTRDSGHLVTMLIIRDDDYFEKLKDQDVNSLKQFVDKVGSNCSVKDYEYLFTVIKPFETGVLSLEEAKQGFQAAEAQLKKANEELALFNLQHE